MRRGPQEDDGEEQDRQKSHITGDGGPTNDRRECARSTADNDILRRIGLKPDCVDDGIKEYRESQQTGRQPVYSNTHDADGKGSKANAEVQRCLTIHSSGGQWPLCCPRHFGVDIGFVPLVQRTTCTSAKGNA